MAMKLKKIGRLGLLLLALALGIGVAAYFGLPWLLVGEANPMRADVIIHLAIGERANADDYAAELYRQGVARKIVCASTQVSCKVFGAEYARRRLISLGVPAEDVQVLPMPETACRAQLVAPIYNLMKEHGWQSMLWVVPPAGSRVTRRVVQPKFKSLGIAMDLTYPAHRREEFLDDWWRQHWKMQAMIMEVLNVTVDGFYPECW
jgi:hypothetical protein